MVKKGNIVVFPMYQSLRIFLSRFTSNAIHSVQDALDELQTGEHVRPDLDKCAIVGHSCGGVLAVNIAALAKESILPVPRAVMTIAPSPKTPLEDLSKVPGDTLLLIVVGDQDSRVGSQKAKEIFYFTPQLSFENKNFITIVSDDHGVPSLVADHTASCCIQVRNRSFGNYGPDALDYYGYWKLFDALTDAAFYDLNREYALGKTPEQMYMGIWGDGTPVKELRVTENPLN